MTCLDQQFDNRARDSPAFLDRLIRVGIGAHRDWAAFVPGAGQSRMEQLRRLGFHEQTGLEIHAGRQVVIGVGRPREAIDAAMLATSIGVDRAVKPDVRRAVAGQDRLRMLYRDGGSPLWDSVQSFDLIEPFALRDPLLKIKSRWRRIAGRAAAMTRFNRHLSDLRL